ncbi:propanol-preferring alcohol dehydrogenase [Kibdelosporangium banguiense]|uniref:alcohol dehydrogenase n=1 Tax=Kibdelosporangium banguiense TaxID=1365924 RepID=A0ABS4TNR9_9PSEU|nr:NAD(P)-dependent alcohol dehydrogenase [Kibdelosporangium banguiense]MBP2326046.1 propanol-preferring alcohol dehydrogenase [Kibdelosporangium banguiense]
MTTARKSTALRLTAWGTPPRLVDLEVPVPQGTEVLIAVEAAGICHSDLHVIDADAGKMPYSVPFTLGHEVAGHVVAVGPAATGIEIGTRVAVYGPWGCGRCRRCAVGHDNYCDRRSELAWSGAGLGRDGGMADHLLVPAPRHLVPIGDLDATQAAPLTDAGLTPYHAIAGLSGKLREGTTVAVIGVGGLGHLAVQILRAVTPSRVLAVDIREDALELAHLSGADMTTLTKPDTSEVLRAATGGTGVDAVFDFVGSDATLALGARTLRAGGDLVVLGSAAGRLTISKPGPLPPGAALSLPFWGTRPELHNVIALAQAGSLRVETELFSLSAAGEALRRLRAGRIRGRAVLVP